MVKHLHHTCDNFVLRAVQQNKRTESLCPQINSAETPFGTCCDIDLCQTVLHGCERTAPLCFLNDYTTCISLCQRENQLFFEALHVTSSGRTGSPSQNEYSMHAATGFLNTRAIASPYSTSCVP